MNIENIVARDLPDAWFQSVYRVLDVGRIFKIDKGSYAGQRRLEFDWINIRVVHPETRPLVPQIEPHYNIPNPVSDDYLDQYLPYLMTGQLKEGEAYTYGQRLTRFPIDFSVFLESYSDTMKEVVISEINELKEKEVIFFDKEFEKWCLNQIELVIWMYKNKGYRNNQMVLQVSRPSDMLLKDPPCLRHIDTRVQDNELHFFPYFRSWDLWNGFPANLGAIQLLKEYMAGEIGVESGEIIATSKGLHVYDYVFDLAKILRMKEDMILEGER